MKGLLFTYLLTYGGAICSLFNPFVGLMVYICFAIIKPEYLWHWSVPAGNYSRIVAIALLMGWALRGFGDWRFGSAKGPLIALLAYLAWSIFSCIFAASNEAIGWLFVENLSKIVLPCVVGMTVIRTRAQLEILAWVITLSYGYVAFELNLSYVKDGFNQINVLGFGGMDNNSATIGFVTSFGLAFFLGMESNVLWRKALGLICAGLIGHVVLLSFSRGGMLSLICSGLACFVLLPKRPQHLLVYAIAIILGIRLAGPEVLERFASVFSDPEDRDYSAQSRLDLWKACWEVMLQRPIFGLGPDHWTLVAHEFGFTHGKEAHSTWMQLGAELGFPGVLSLLLYYLICVGQLLGVLRDRLQSHPAWLLRIARMVIASISGFLVASQFVTLEGLEVPYYITLLGASALVVASRESAWAVSETVHDPGAEPFVGQRDPHVGHYD